MNNLNKLLYIGLNGLAGSGKDTVAKMLNVILMNKWDNIQDCYKYYNEHYAGPSILATFNQLARPYQDRIMCIAFADQLKNICASIFGIPVDRFYNNKSNAWICINKDFHYTEVRPQNVITCEEYYYNCSEYKNSSTKYYLSLRDILVYIGTYVLQQDVNKDVFINIVQNNITSVAYNNANLKYVIVTDIRFSHELDYVKDHNGITIKIVNPNVKALENIAEHDLDDEDDYTYIINNDGTYEELFEKVWDLAHSVVFNNTVIDLYTRDNVNNYLRQIEENEWLVCSPYGVNRINHSQGGNIFMIDLVGGPVIEIGEYIPGTNLIAEEINLDENGNKFIITTKKGDC